MQDHYDLAVGRPLNVSLLAGSKAHHAYYDRAASSASELTADQFAAGFPELCPPAVRSVQPRR